MTDVCDSCRFGFPEQTDDGYYCEIYDDVFKQRTVCGSWGCKLSRIGTPDELEHNVHYDADGNWHPTDENGNWTDREESEQCP